MRLFEALEQVEERLALKEDYGKEVPEYFEALEIAADSIKAQIDLADYINSIEEDSEECFYSSQLVLDILKDVFIGKR